VRKWTISGPRLAVKNARSRNPAVGKPLFTFSPPGSNSPERPLATPTRSSQTPPQSLTTEPELHCRASRAVVRAGPARSPALAPTRVAERPLERDRDVLSDRERRFYRLPPLPARRRSILNRGRSHRDRLMPRTSGHSLRREVNSFSSASAASRASPFSQHSPGPLCLQPPFHAALYRAGSAARLRTGPAHHGVGRR